MPYTAVNPPTYLIPMPTLPTQQQQQQLEQSLHRQNQWPGKRVTLTKRSPTHDVVTIAGSPSKLGLGMEYTNVTNVYPQQIPNSAQRNARPSSPQGSPKLELLNAIISNSLKSVSPSSRRASYSSSPNKPSPLQISSQETVSLLSRTMSSGNLTSIRKKSGEILKPSLKRTAKSAPTTPTCPKYVHFDTKLEHVRLFLQAETPDAVKEDAEPETEEDEEERTSDLSLVLPNWPAPSTMSNARMVFVESIVFSDDKSSLNGRIQVQNIAFHKNVTVRYTFDYWQSVHESHALYKESISKDKSSFDRFTFQISLVGKVGDNVAPEDEQRTMYFAVRYNVEGREIWDNNGGMNYQVEFKRTSTVPKPKVASWSTSDPKDKDQQKSDILSSSPLSSSPSNEALPLKKKSPGNRYDFSASLSAAKKVAPVTTAPVSVPVQPSSRPTSSSPARVQQNWPSYYPGVTTASSIVDGYPTTYGFSDEYLSASLAEPSMNSALNNWDSMRSPLDFSYGASSTTPISIPKSTRPAAGSSGYFDLVNKYCFYGGNTSPYSSSPYSNSPPAAVIRG